MKIGYRKGSDVSDDGDGIPLLFKDSIGVVYGAELNVQIPLILSLLPFSIVIYKSPDEMLLCKSVATITTKFRLTSVTGVTS